MALLLLADCVSDTLLHPNRSSAWFPDVSWLARWNSGDASQMSGLGDCGIRPWNSLKCYTSHSAFRGFARAHRSAGSG